MFLGPRLTLGGFVPDDYGAMYCWANDIAAARFDGAFRPANLRDVIASCETGNDASRVMLAIRQRTDPKIIGYINIHNVSAVHRSADLGMRIGDEKNRGQGLGKEALAMAVIVGIISILSASALSCSATMRERSRLTRHAVSRRKAFSSAICSWMEPGSI
jgi:hypothetical protein